MHTLNVANNKRNTMKKLLYLAISLFVINTTAQSVAINNDGSAPDDSAVLDLKSSNQGVLVPRMTQANRNAITTPATGLMVFQTDNTPGFYFNAGTPEAPNWQAVGGGGSTSSPTVVLDVECTTAGNYNVGEAIIDVSGFPRYDNVLVTPPANIGTFQPFINQPNAIQPRHVVNTTGTSFPNQISPAFIANQAGYYAITATIVAVIGSTALDNPVSIAPFINVTTSAEAHKEAFYGSSTTSTGFPRYTRGRGTVSAVVKLDVGDKVGIFGTNTSTNTATTNSTDGSTKWTIVKL